MRPLIHLPLRPHLALALFVGLSLGVAVMARASTVSSNAQSVTAGPWLALSQLAGHSYASGSDILKFLQRSDDTYLIYDSTLGGGRTGYEAFALKRTSSKTAVMLNDHINRVVASITLLPDGWIERSGFGNGHEQIVVYQIVGGELWRNVDTVTDGQVVRTRIRKYRPV
jgi:hypothetical protein